MTTCGSFTRVYIRAAWDPSSVLLAPLCQQASSIEDCCNAAFEFASDNLRGGAANIFENMKNTITGQKASKSTSKRRQKKMVIDEDDHLLEKGLRIVKVKGDGRCLFRALVRKTFLLASTCIPAPPQKEKRDIIQLYRVTQALGTIVAKLL